MMSLAGSTNEGKVSGLVPAEGTNDEEEI